MTGELARALNAFAERDLAALVASGGLPAGTAVDDVLAEWDGDRDDLVRHVLGRPPQEAFWCPVMLDGFTSVRVWFRGETVLRIVGEWPALSWPAATALGPPAARLDYRLDVTLLDRAEYVWPAAGLAIRRDPDSETVVAIVLFAATELGDYEVRLRESDDDYRESGPATGMRM